MVERKEYPREAKERRAALRREAKAKAHRKKN
jgi:hypothetical protein